MDKSRLIGPKRGLNARPFWHSFYENDFGMSEVIFLPGTLIPALDDAPGYEWQPRMEVER